MLEHLERLLHLRGNFNFDSSDNFIRCFSHIINLCSQAVLKSMLKDDTAEHYSDTETDDATASNESDAGPIQRARKTVAFVRKSGQRRDELASIIEQGNVNQAWVEVQPDNSQVVIFLKCVTLLPGVKTRWDSEFYMLRRLRYLREVSVPSTFFSPSLTDTAR
ncbi:hypothetical protein GGX14DRAFT_378288 [Mycena pura]|uniref:Uncharacterized protein n=1 Tax=Mycena pura TaxID=153505 RepID=A0AAD6UR34_9AGAR|nr:hypothetical protein GGX14DRAFT_382134 [Mycena pura]KAJ7194128.1 hypothetical protein GGX14DRAFT_378288 [Mycena pura]